jgi:hypothetical protein
VTKEYGRTISPEDRADGDGRILQYILLSGYDGQMEFSIGGNTGYWTAKNGYPIRKGFGFRRDSVRDGWRAVRVGITDCHPGVDICDKIFVGKQKESTGEIQWDGAAPPPLTDYIPQEAQFATYFQPLFDKQTADIDAWLKTGLDWFDSKHWYEHSLADVGLAQSQLTAAAKARLEGLARMIDLEKAVSAAGGAAIGGVPGAFVGSFVGNVVWGAVGRWGADKIRQQDADWCKKLDYNFPGCEEYRHLENK